MISNLMVQKLIRINDLKPKYFSQWKSRMNKFSFSCCLNYKNFLVPITFFVRTGIALPWGRGKKRSHFDPKIVHNGKIALILSNTTLLLTMQIILYINCALIDKYYLCRHTVLACLMWKLVQHCAAPWKTFAFLQQPKARNGATLLCNE